MEIDLESNRKRSATDSSESSTRKNVKSTPPGKSFIKNNAAKDNSSSSSPLAKNRNLINFRYASTDKPPFIVHIRTITDEGNNDTGKPPDTHPLLIGRVVTQIVSGGLQEIKKISKGHVQVVLTSAEAANRLIDDRSLASYGLKAFIPSYKTARTGIIRDIPQSLTIENLLENLESSPKTIEAHRLNRRIKDGNSYRYEPSRSVCVKFAGQSLPNSVSIFKVRHTIFLFVPKVKICFSCYRAGHISKVCKDKPCCLYCGKDKHDEGIECSNKDSPYKCINCGGPHLAKSFDCPIITNLKKVYALAAAKNIPLFEAKKKINSSFNNSDSRFDYFNYPDLPTSQASSFSSPTDPQGYTSYNRFTELLKHRENDIPFSYANALSNSKKSSLRSSSTPSSPRSHVTFSDSSPAQTSGRNKSSSYTYTLEHREALFFPDGRTQSNNSNPVFSPFPRGQNLNSYSP
ncbi:uncharacterized protein [Temnothorax nylanderi]|uniref:uncharacterized protein n=1 Tax=Temnothorax nylanderi TaxID=102681 RepID=UPI003A8596E2